MPSIPSPVPEIGDKIETRYGQEFDHILPSMARSWTKFDIGSRIAQHDRELSSGLRIERMTEAKDKRPEPTRRNTGSTGPGHGS